MSGSIAELGFAVNSSAAVQAATDLDKLVDAGKEAEGSAKRVGGAWEQALSSLNSNTQQIVKELQSLNAKQDTTAQLMATVGKTLADVSQGFAKTASAANDLVVAETKVSSSADDSSARLLAMAKASLEASEYHQSLTNSLKTSGAAIDGAKKATTDWAAEQELANQRGQRLLETEARQAEAAKKAAAATGVQADGLQLLLAKINPTLSALQKLDDLQDQLGQYKKAGLIDAETFKDYSSYIEAARAKQKDFNGEVKESKGGLSALALNSKEARENVLQLGNALAEGNFRVAAHNILEIGTNAGASALRMAALFAPVGLVVAGLGTLAAAYIKGSEEEQAFSKALILTGNAAGTSATSLASMAKQVSATVGTTGAAADVLTRLAANGNIAAYSFTNISKAALVMQEATGKAVEQTVAEFSELAKDPVAASAKLNEQYHYLTASVYEQITALEKQGDKAAAVKLATDSFADAIEARGTKITERLGYVEGAWNKVAKAAKWAWDAALDVGRDATYEEKMAELAKQAENARRLAPGARGTGNRGLAQIESDQNSLMLAEQDRRRREQANKDSQSRQDEAVNGVQLINREAEAAKTSVQKLQDKLDDLAKARQKNIANNSFTPELQKQYETAVAGYQKQLDDAKKKAAGPAGAVDLTAFNNSKLAMVSLVDGYKNSEKELDAAQKAGLISQAQYFSQRSVLIEAEKEQVTAAYQAEIAALEAAKNKSGTTAAQQVEIDQKIATARSEMVRAQKDADSQLKVLSANETGRLNAQAAASKAYVEQLERQRAALEASGTRAASALGLGDRQQGLQSSLDATTDKFNDERAKLLDRRRTSPDKYSLDDYKKDLASLQDAENSYRNTVVGNYDKMTEAQSHWESGAQSAYRTYLESAQNVSGMTKSLFTNAFSSLEDVVVNFATTGKASFADFAKSVIADLTRIATRQAAAGLLSSGVSAFGSLFGSGSSGSAASDYTGSAFSSYVAGARATGGGVSPNSLYQVNELGPELYSQGGKSYLMTGANGGSVTPLTSGASASMASSGGSSPVSVSISIASDGTTDVAGNQAGLSSFGTEIGSLVEQKYKQLEAKSLSPQGNIRKAINGRA